MEIKNKIGLGTVQFGLNYGIANQNGQTSKFEVHKILKYAKEAGITILDSASAYGNAEEIIGEYGLRNFKLVSKYRPAIEVSTIQEQLEKSLQNLHVNSLYAYLVHSPKDLIKNPAEWTQLKEIQKQGKVKKIGYSLNEPFELDKLLELNLIPDIVQVPYNYFDRRFEEKFEKLKNLGCEIHTRSVFLQGLFFLSPSNLHEYFEPVKKDLKKLQEQNSFSAGSLLKFVLENPFIDKVIIGVATKTQLEENLRDLATAKSLDPFHNTIDSNILIPSLWPKK